MMSLPRFTARLCSKSAVVSQARCSARRYKSSPAAETKAKDAAAKPAEKVAEKTAEKAEKTPVAQAAIAAILGVATVSAAANTVENATAASVPKFDPSTQRFDQTDFSGRFSKMLLACDPRLLFYTEEQVRSSQKMLENYKDYEGMDRALWEARRIVDSALHPDTGDTIPRPFRMSGYVPYNGPICVAILASQSTLPLLFWAWINQSQNALVNYYNRNGSSPMKNETLALSYGAAVGSALFVAFGLATFIQKKYEPSKAKQLLKYVAFPSAVVASTLNCYIIRSPEIESGIPLTNKEGEAILPGETSSVAAAQGVYTTTASRAILQIPVYVFAPVLMALPPFLQILARAPGMAVPLTTYLVLVSFGVGLPATTSIFPQISSIAAADVEPKYQHLRDSNDKTYEVYYYNKGL